MAHPAENVVLRNLPYAEGVEVQRQWLTRLAEDRTLPGMVIFAEHLPVITCGRSGDGSNLLASEAELAENGIEFHPAGRGGDVTYHGPGQWTVYPILRLDWYNRSLHHYLRLLEECVIRFLSHYGVEGGRREGLTGAWVAGGKVAAVGVAVSRWITWHGFALNIHPELSRFTRFMHPCGITAERGGVASLESLTGRKYSMEDSLIPLRRAVAEVLELEFAEGCGGNQ